MKKEDYIFKLKEFILGNKKISFLDREDLIFELDNNLNGFNYTKKLYVNKLNYKIDNKLQISIDNFENDYPEYYIN